MFSSTKVRKTFRAASTCLPATNQIELMRDNYSQGASFKYFNGQEGGRVNPHSYPRLPRRKPKVLLRGQSASINKGFTLIEILVVIAIIGILAGIILVAMGPVREKGKDTKIESNMLQLQQLAENLYLDNGTYDNLDPVSSPEVAAIENDIIAQGGSSLTIKKPSSPADTYCAYTSLNKTLDGQQVYYCTDYLFRNQQIGDPSIGCYDTCFVCPACLDSNGDGLMTAGPDPIPNELLNMFISSCWGQPASCNPSLDLDCNGIINILDVMSYSGLIPYPCL